MTRTKQAQQGFNRPAFKMVKGKKSSSKQESKSLLEDYLQKYLDGRPDPVEYESFLNEQIEAVEESEHKKAEELEAMAGQPDNDGFVTVVNKRPGAALVVQEEAEEASGGQRKGKKFKSIDNFYQADLKSEKRNKLDELRQRFEDDKKRIDELKRAKQFHLNDH